MNRQHRSLYCEFWYVTGCSQGFKLYQQREVVLVVFIFIIHLSFTLLLTDRTDTSVQILESYTMNDKKRCDIFTSRNHMKLSEELEGNSELVDLIEIHTNIKNASTN